MIDEIRAKLEDEIVRLTHELNVELPGRIQKAVELGDLRENSEYKSALERQQFVQALKGSGGPTCLTRPLERDKWRPLGS